MQIDRRFADYGLTGGFFLICQLGLLWALGYWPTNIPNDLKVLLSSSAPLVGPIITGFAGALAVIAVFVVGLILDLFASLFRGTEMKIFARHLDHNSDWMTDFIKAHRAYCGSDYETFQRVFHELPPLLTMLKQAGFDTFTLWRRESRHRYVAAVKVTWGLSAAPQYERLSSFFTSYIMGQSGSAQLTLMADQYSLWRTARAIAAALWLFTLEAMLVVMFVAFFVAIDAIFGDRIGDGGGNFIIHFFVVGSLVLLGQCIIYLIIRGTYYRLCITLFSLMYVACDKQLVSRKDAEPAP